MDLCHVGTILFIFNKCSLVLLLCKFGWNWLQTNVLLYNAFKNTLRKATKKLTKIGGQEKNWHVINGTTSEKQQNMGWMKRRVGISHTSKVNMKISYLLWKYVYENVISTRILAIKSPFYNLHDLLIGTLGQFYFFLQDNKALLFDVGSSWMFYMFSQYM